ncbi:MAG: hypothetical protein IKG99_10085 [Bacteroidaceae bacterium]|nr:hypothetical protein [Bacteroidaceae bacterium]
MILFIPNMFSNARNVQGFAVWGGLFIALWTAMQPDEHLLSQNEICISYTIVLIAFTGTINIIRIKKVFPFSSLDIIIFTWYIYFLARSYFKTVYPCDTYSIRATIAVMLYCALRLAFASTIIREREIATAILLFVLCEAGMGIFQIMNGKSRHQSFIATGSFLNPAPFAAVLSSGLVMIAMWKRRIIKLISMKKGKKARNTRYGIWLLRLSNFVMASLLILILSTVSRAALLATSICLGIIYQKTLRRYRTITISLFLLVLIPLYHIKPGSVNGRVINYRISCLNLGNNPVIGNGIGGYFHQYAEKMSQFSQCHPDFDFINADVLEFAFCDILKVGVEQGIIGLSIMATFLCRLYFILQRKGKTLWIGFMSILLFSLFSYPFELFTFQIISVVIIAYAATNKAGGFSKHNKDNYNLRLILHIGITSILVLCSIATAKRIHQKMQAQTDFIIKKNIRDENSIKDYYHYLPLLNDNTEFLFDFGNSLSKHGRLIESNKILSIGTLLTNDPVFYVLIGNNYMNMKSYDQAEKAYKKAFHILPNRLYPLYQLMRLYEQTGDKNKQKLMAQRILSFKVKVISHTTEAMKDSARLYLKTQRNEHIYTNYAKFRRCQKEGVPLTMSVKRNSGRFFNVTLVGKERPWTSWKGNREKESNDIIKNKTDRPH